MADKDRPADRPDRKTGTPAEGQERVAKVDVEKAAIENKPEKQDVRINVEQSKLPVGRVALGAAAVLFVLFLTFVVYRSLTILLLLFIAVLVATAIEPLVNRLRKGPFSRSTGILVVYSGLFLIIGAILYLTFSVFLTQLSAFGSALGTSVTEMRQGVSEMDTPFLRQQVTIALDVADTFVARVQRPDVPDTDEEKLAAVTATATVVGELFFAITTIFVVAFYWLSERTLLKRGLMTWLPPKRANRVRRVWDDIEIKVGGWVRGQLMLMAIIGLTSAVGYFVLGVKYWPALALIIGIAEVIPLVGPYIGTAPAVIVALTQSGNDGLPALLGMGDFGGVVRALLVVAFAVVLQTVEGNVLIPRVMKNSVGISPLTVIVAILFGATLAGLAGALVAVPLAGAIQVVLSDLKAARQSEMEFEEETEHSEQVRAEAGELVVAYSEDGTTETRVESSSAKAEA
ncbi:MAG TPA: AI-2E family transporter [Chloroflexia bacterium]|nr:AI-2E family transporter [Chloroflexia bacterium]